MLSQGKFFRSSRSLGRPLARLFSFSSSRPMKHTGTPSIVARTRDRKHSEKPTPDMAVRLVEQPQELFEVVRQPGRSHS